MEMVGRMRAFVLSSKIFRIQKESNLLEAWANIWWVKHAPKVDTPPFVPSCTLIFEFYPYPNPLLPSMFHMELVSQIVELVSGTVQKFGFARHICFPS